NRALAGRGDAQAVGRGERELALFGVPGDMLAGVHEEPQRRVARGGEPLGRARTLAEIDGEERRIEPAFAHPRQVALRERGLRGAGGLRARCISGVALRKVPRSVLLSSLPMSNAPVENVVIIGTGCAGLTAAIYTARANLNPLVLEGPLPGGQLTTTSEVENFPGFPQGVDGFQLMQNLREQATRFGTRFEQALITSVDFNTMPRQLVAGDRTILARSVIIATGASPRMTGIPGEKELYGGK